MQQHSLQAQVISKLLWEKSWRLISMRWRLHVWSSQERLHDDRAYRVNPLKEVIQLSGLIFR